MFYRNHTPLPPRPRPSKTTITMFGLLGPGVHMVGGREVHVAAIDGGPIDHVDVTLASNTRECICYVRSANGRWTSSRW